MEEPMRAFDGGVDRYCPQNFIQQTPGSGIGADEKTPMYERFLITFLQQSNDCFLASMTADS